VFPNITCSDIFGKTVSEKYLHENYGNPNNFFILKDLCELT